MKQILFIAFSFLSISCFSQEATFSIDTTRVSQFKINGSYRENISALEWIINGKHLKFGSPPIKVKITTNGKTTIVPNKTGTPQIKSGGYTANDKKVLDFNRAYVKAKKKIR